MEVRSARLDLDKTIILTANFLFVERQHATTLATALGLYYQSSAVLKEIICKSNCTLICLLPLLHALLKLRADVFPGGLANFSLFDRTTIKWGLGTLGDVSMGELA